MLFHSGLDNPNIDINARNDFKDTPLHEASSSCHSLTVQKLIKKGAKKDAINNESMTPLMLAQKELEDELGRSSKRRDEDDIAGCEHTIEILEQQTATEIINQ